MHKMEIGLCETDSVATKKKKLQKNFKKATSYNAKKKQTHKY